MPDTETTLAARALSRRSARRPRPRLRSRPWCDNIIVDDCRRLLASFMHGAPPGCRRDRGLCVRRGTHGVGRRRRRRPRRRRGCSSTRTPSSSPGPASPSTSSTPACHGDAHAAACRSSPRSGPACRPGPTRTTRRSPCASSAWSADSAGQRARQLPDPPLIARTRRARWSGRSGWCSDRRTPWPSSHPDSFNASAAVRARAAPAGRTARRRRLERHGRHAPVRAAGVPEVVRRRRRPVRQRRLPHRRAPGVANDFTIVERRRHAAPSTRCANVGRCLVDGLDVIIERRHRLPRADAARRPGRRGALAAALGVPDDRRAAGADRVAHRLPRRLGAPRAPDEDPTLVYTGLGTESCARLRREWVAVTGRQRQSGPASRLRSPATATTRSRTIARAGRGPPSSTPADSWTAASNVSSRRLRP